MKEKLIILDLDETLVYASEGPIGRDADFLIDSRYHVYWRPGLDAFLAYCFSRFMVAVWTSSSTSYAAALVPMVFPDPTLLEFVWARDRCTLHHDMESRTEHWVKSLRKIKQRGFSLEKTLMIDDSPEKLVRNFGNHVRVEPFEGDPADRELPLLARYLETLLDVPNVRSIEKRNWKRKLETAERFHASGTS